MNAENEIFGDPTDFAIEVGLEPGAIHTAGFLWGHTRLWYAGIPLGNIDNRHCGLNASDFYEMSTRLDDLWDKSLAGLDDETIWNHLNAILYGYHGDIELQDDRNLEEIERDSCKYSKFNFLTNWGEQFDGFKSFLICPPNKTLRVLNRSFPKSIGLGVNISKSCFIQASNDFYNWHQLQLQRHKTESDSSS